jgi:transposase
MLSEQATQMPSAKITLDAAQRADAPAPKPDFQRVRDPYRKKVHDERRAKRLARYERVLELHEQGVLQQEIAQHLRIGRATVRRYVAADGFPERVPYPRLESKLDPYTAYLAQRWAAGEINGQRLWQELRAQGFTGSRMTVMRWAERQHVLAPPLPTTRRGRNHQARNGQGQQVAAPLRTRRIVWWLLRRPNMLSVERQVVLQHMEAGEPVFGELYRLSVAFTEMLRNRQPERLRQWLDQVQASEFRELRSLATGMERDYAAVEAGLRLPYSTGPVEGNINRLKLIKRSGYGRASFDLLRLRVLET